MKIVLQRVSQSSVTVEGKVVGQIGRGILIYLGIIKGDTEEEARYLATKVAQYRIFPDQERKMNLSVLDIGGESLVISQFTLAASGKKGNRPSFDDAAPPPEAERLYEKFIGHLRSLKIPTQSGVFGAYMQVSSVNDGPVTFILER